MVRYFPPQCLWKRKEKGGEQRKSVSGYLATGSPIREAKDCFCENESVVFVPLRRIAIESNTQNVYYH